MLHSVRRLSAATAARTRSATSRVRSRASCKASQLATLTRTKIRTRSDTDGEPESERARERESERRAHRRIQLTGRSLRGNNCTGRKAGRKGREEEGRKRRASLRVYIALGGSILLECAVFELKRVGFHRFSASLQRPSRLAQWPEGRSGRGWRGRPQVAGPGARCRAARCRAAACDTTLF